MDSSTFLKKGIVGLVLLVTIGLLSLAVTFSRMPASQIIINAGVIRSSSFALSFYDTTGNLLFSVSPQNDYFYTNSVKDHLEDKISGTDNGNFLQNVWISLRSLVFNQKELIWNTVGSSANGQESVNYTVNQVNGGVEIQRAVAAKSNIKSLGQVLQFCADCLVTDDKKRIYFNADTVTQADLETAARLSLTPVVIGENQFLPQDIKEVRVIDGNNNLKLEIPVLKAQVFLQYKWRLLEFKASLKNNGTAVSQEVLLNE
jgi:hypothetical protein